MSVLSTLPTLERGRSGQTSTCLGAFTLPIRSLTNAISSAGSTLLPGAQLDHGGDPLAPLLVRQPDHRAVLDGRVRHQRLLDLGRVHVEAAGDDHVLGPVDDEQEAVVVEVADVAGVVPAVRATPRRSPPGSCSSRPSPASRGPRSRRARRPAAGAPSSVHDRDRDQRASGARPRTAARVATEPSGRKWSRRRPSSRSSSAPRSARTAAPSPGRSGSAPPPAGPRTSARRRTRSTAATTGPWRRALGCSSTM